MLTPIDLVDARPRELADLMAAGAPFDRAALAGWVYRGTSLGLPAWIERLAWKKFAKVFDRDHATGRLHGWNMRIEQDGLDRPWTPKRRRGRVVTFGPFDVVDGDGGVLLDYRVARGPLSTLRNPVVALRAGSTELLLGRTLVDLRVTTVGTPSYFVLERGEPLTADLARSR